MRQFSDADFNVFLVALDYESREEVNTFLQKIGVDFPVILGNEALQVAFKVDAYPTYYFLDKAGTVRFGSVGYSSWIGLKLRSFFI